MDNPGMPAAAPHNNPSRPVLIAGGGIGGMATALTLHQIGVPCIVFESVAQLQPLGVGINLQPNAVRELHDLGFGNDVLDTIGLQAREWALVGRNGNEIYAEPRGLQAGYRWPQYSVHRGQLQMMLFNAVKERLGEGAVRLGHRVVLYPITPPDPATGLATINWIAEITVDNQGGWPQGDWNRRVALQEFIHHFDGWNYSWLDVPAMLRGASDIFEYPMIDRDPVPTWVDGRVALLGDAAHVMYPVGSNGASQAIVDARVLGAQFIAHGVGPQALRAYDDRLCKDISALVLRNRGSGPFGLLGLVDERCGGVFDHIDDVLPREEREGFMARYKAAAGFAIEALNAAAPTIAPGQRVARD
jgi:2-polyprenyl-6-methoxyphenol hydroxylase-like FAD-dependent oxidoreductase